MPIIVTKIPETGAIVYEHFCEICGGYATFGIDVFLKKAFNALDRKDIKLAKELLGKWYCGEHWRFL